MRRLLLVSVVLGATLAVAPAAQAFKYFKTPTGNIVCGAYNKNYIRCDLRSADNTPPPRPTSCEFDWGFSFGLSNNGSGRRNCVSDAPTPYPPRHVLRYGKTFKYGKITCKSRTSGLTCKNKRKHGFFISRASQRVF